MRGVWLCVALAACLDPTEVTLELSSDACDQLGPVDIVVGNTDASVATASCSASGRIGRLVFVPSQRGNKFEVAVGACDKTRTHCIRAARSVRFVPHTPLRLPVSLDRACMDVLCQPDFTCSGGACVPEDVTDHCIGGVCTPNMPADAGPPPSCVPWVNAPPANSFIWHFDSPTTVDQFGLCPPTTAIDIGPGMGTCGTAAFESAYDGGQSAAHALGCKAAGSGTNVHLAFWFRVGSGSYFVQKIDSSMMAVSGWAIGIGGGGSLYFRSAGIVDMMTLLGPPLSLGTWHAVEIDASNGNLTAWLDKMKVLSVSGIQVGASPNANIAIGPLGGGAIDELYIYP